MGREHTDDPASGADERGGLYGHDSGTKYNIAGSGVSEQRMGANVFDDKPRMGGQGRTARGLIAVNHIKEAKKFVLKSYLRSNAKRTAR